jgi:hypothetical protein
MALTKLPKNAFGTGSVDASKIEDGTVQNVELTDATLTSEKFATGTIANASLSNSTITINGTSISLGGSSSVGVDVNWQSVQTTGFTAVAANGYFVDTTSGAITVTLPASASLGDQIAIKDYAGTFASNNLTIGRNGHNIQGVANDSLISTNRASLLLVYVDSTKGWIYAEESNVADLQGPTFISATGGTITTSGDYKIHTFTGDGCFVVASIGNCAAPAPQRDKVDYLVVAGGASGGFGDIGGGGGAGGFRLSNSTCMPGPQTSPLANPTGITVSATTYPITVGGGGAPVNISSSPTIGTSGSNSIFSTITSAGGGGGGGNGIPIAPGQPGGSGGGASYRCGTGGSGNTPPVSPPQGNNGGTSASPPQEGAAGSGGGGGAGAVGVNGTRGPTGEGGPGGVGSFVVQTGFGGCNGTTGPVSGTRYFSGGGGGSVEQGTNTSGGTGGSGGGGNAFTASPSNTASTAGAANTGGGGGGGENGFSSPGAAGGKGIVIIRYKFQ